MQKEVNDLSMRGKPDPFTMIVFGASGDLAKRKIFPAIYNLFLSNRLPDKFQVIGASRTKRSHEEFRQKVEESIQNFSRREIEDRQLLEQFLQRFFYCPTDVNDVDSYHGIYETCTSWEAKENSTGNRLFYLSIRPELFGNVAVNLGKAGLTDTKGWKRLIIEKPFGSDYQTAQELDQQIKQSFTEEETFRIDHYLGKEMVQNIETIRFANTFLEPLWNRNYIKNIQITASETVGVEQRAGYYDQAGALRDMMQNHMLQLLMMTAMEPLSRLDDEGVHVEKTKILRSIRRVGLDEMPQYIARGQYVSGEINGKMVPSYREEEGVAPGSQTETYVAAKFFIDNHRWAGVPFYVRTGKRMAVKATEIIVEFKELPPTFYSKDTVGIGSNLLVLRISPKEEVSLFINMKRTENMKRLRPVPLVTQPVNQKEVPEAYEILIYDAIFGDRTFFTHQDEVLAAWEIIDPIFQAFQEGVVPLEYYPSGTWGPKSADLLLHASGDAWWTVADEYVQLREIDQHTKERGDFDEDL